ncbi:MAG: hypothetical protein EOO03_09650 [Chitinophagaceae bacterium]|nr:MAG: hypothetical protein EOO03_09650 [Chitinophagaceae bacterium]
MEQIPEIFLSSTKLGSNETLTVRAASNSFEQRQYAIANEAGHIVRKGVVGEHIAEFTLCMVGLGCGVYRFCMGKVQERFIIAD